MIALEVPTSRRSRARGECASPAPSPAEKCVKEETRKKGDDKEKWEEAIAKDGLSWTHVSDLKGWKNAVAEQYGIRAIPQNLLLDPQGKIIGKNLRGDALDKKLEEILASK